MYGISMRSVLFLLFVNYTRKLLSWNHAPMFLNNSKYHFIYYLKTTYLT